MEWSGRIETCYVEHIVLFPTA